MAPRKWSRKLAITKDPAELLTIALDSHAFLRAVDGHSFLLDEIVSHQFHGRPSLPLAAKTVTHFDDNMWNCIRGGRYAESATIQLRRA